MRVVLSLLLGSVVMFLLVSLLLAVLSYLLPGFINALPWIGVVVVFGGALAIITWMCGIWGVPARRRHNIKR